MTFETSQQGSIDGTFVRGGTSRGFFVRERNLPESVAIQNDLANELFGSGDPIQVDGIGGSHSHTSKMMIVSPSERPGVDVDYTFVQVGIEKRTVDRSGNCGNLTSAIGLFGMLEGIVEASEPRTSVTLYNTNTDTRVEQTIPVVEGEPAVYGEYSIDGIPGTGARIDSTFVDPAGGVTDSLFPTGQATETVTVDGTDYEVSIVDVANPNVFVRATDLGLDGTELPTELESTDGVLDRLEDIRSVACERIGLVDDAADATEERPAVPFPAIVAKPQSYPSSVDRDVGAEDQHVTARIISNQRPHHAYAMTGAMCLGAAANVPGTVPSSVAEPSDDGTVVIGHPKGTITVDTAVDASPSESHVESVTVRRTARPIADMSVMYRYVGDLESLADEGSITPNS